jgi:hypothetical protein
MQKEDTSRVMHRIAAAMRAQAQETSQPDYRALMNRTADSLDVEAAAAAEAHYQEFSHMLSVFSDKVFSRSDWH